MQMTDDQKYAVNINGTNAIVSAGAGSGKTTVLKERVLRHLLEGTSIDSLILLTFTKNAASEMKERIRKIISENETVKSEAQFLDNAYITTFDSFAQSIVKKYNYLLNIGKDFSIADASIVKLQTTKFIDEIFESYYKEENELFESFISNYCIKDDKKIREAIYSIYQKYTSIIDKDNFINTYEEKYYSKDFIENAFNKYEDIVFKIRDEIITILDQINDETTDQKIIEENLSITSNFREATMYNELLYSPLETLKRSKDAYTEEGKELKKELQVKKKELKEYLTEPKEMLINNYLLTKDYTLLILEIIRKLDYMVMNFKINCNAYEFNDIALKAIELVKNFSEVREEIKNKTYEIIIDEYQDTNDIQEEFISYISNNNVYVVGDVKQSIYRFRNANPSIFKDKYNKYKNKINGEKIDLKENFRSRDEVVIFINEVFSNIMFDEIGGANYKDEHKMIFGNKTYNNYKLGNYNAEILKYNKEDKKEFTKEEIETFIIADDILKRIKNEEKVLIFDKEPIVRNITFKDFAILASTSTNFELIKKILESKGIPVAIYKDIDVKNEDEIYILKNIISLIISIKNKDFTDNFKHSFISISRSYLLRLSDEEIFDIFNDNSFYSTPLYKKCYELSKLIDSLSLKEILCKIIEEFDFYNKIITVNDTTIRLAKLEYFVENSSSLNKFGMDIYKIKDYFDEVLKGDEKLDMPTNIESSNSVKIMTIHKSKGLEFNYVYLPFLYNKFRFEKESDYRLTNFGIQIPFYNNGLGNSFISTVQNELSRNEDLSERIRLFYVALTRAKEKIVLLDEGVDRDDKDIPLYKATSNSDLLYIARRQISKYFNDIDLNAIDINKDYNLTKDYNYKDFIKKSKDKIVTKTINIENEKLETKHFSKTLNSLMDNDLRTTLDYGTYMHEVFEAYDFKNDNLASINVSDIYKETITKFLRHKEVENIKNALVFKEHEIYFTKEENTYKGVIDLLIKYDDHFDIIDYKLSNLDSEEYITQLNGYKNYIESKYNLPVNIYLYSILKDAFKKI